MANISNNNITAIHNNDQRKKHNNDNNAADGEELRGRITTMGAKQQQASTEHSQSTSTVQSVLINNGLLTPK